MVQLKKNDRVEITRSFRRTGGTETFTAVVSWVEEREFGIYFGYVPDSVDNGLFGALRLEREPKPFGAQVKVIGHVDPKPTPQPFSLFRHRGYDLMHDPAKGGAR